MIHCDSHFSYSHACCEVLTKIHSVQVELELWMSSNGEPTAMSLECDARRLRDRTAAASKGKVGISRRRRSQQAGVLLLGRQQQQQQQQQGGRRRQRQRRARQPRHTNAAASANNDAALCQLFTGVSVSQS
jgi:hypothetical protein